MYTAQVLYKENSTDLYQIHQLSIKKWNSSI